MALEPTVKQQRFLRYLEREMARTGRAPGLRQAAADLGVSHGAISRKIRTLEDKGLLRREGRYSRTLHLRHRGGQPGRASRWLAAPIVGRGSPPVFPFMPSRNSMARWWWTAPCSGGKIRVRGDSMTGAAILDGDLAVCQPRQYAENGETVVALIRQEEATVKRFFRRPGPI